ncbi:MAG: Ig-like domain-containing protein, partial [Candidatus Margulisiibacteriota bacterium]
MFKKMFVLLVLAVVAMGALVGCGQQTPTVNTTSSQPKGLTIRGTVYGLTIDGNRGNPIAGATLVLNGGAAVSVSGVKSLAASYLTTTVTGSNGEFVFTDLPQSAYYYYGFTVVATKDGYQRNITEDIALTGLTPLPENAEVTVNIDMDGNPAVLSISPMPGTTIEAAAKTIVVAFNEAMDRSSVRPTLTTKGIRTYAIGDTQTLTTTWSADSKILYITTGTLLANQTYNLKLDPSSVAKDVSGYLLETSPPSDSGGLDSTTYNATVSDFYYRTASSGVPGAPTGLLLTVNNTTEVNYSDVDGGAEAVNLSWLAPSSGSITGYKVYVSPSASGPWALLSSASVNTLTSNTTNVNTALYGSMYNADCIRQLAFVNDAVYFSVIAYNGEGEGSGVTTSKRDSVKPTITTLTGAVDRNPATVGIPIVGPTNYETAGATLNMGCYIAFSEPMNTSTLTDAAKYTLSTGGPVVSATVKYSSGGLTVVELASTTAITPAVTTVTVEASTSGPTDIS